MLTVRYDRLGLTRGDLLLDLGAGGGRHAFEAVKRGARVVAIDASQKEITEAHSMFAAISAESSPEWSSKGQGGGVVGDALRLPFPDDTFDRVIAAEVMEHIPDDRGALDELVRVIRPGGTIAITVPRWYPELINWAFSNEYHEVQGGHVRIYRRNVLEERMGSAGLRVEGHHHAHALHSPYWWLKTLVGVDRDDHRLVQAYHRLLVWDIVRASPLTKVPERILNPAMGKSVVVYARKPYLSPGVASSSNRVADRSNKVAVSGDTSPSSTSPVDQQK